MKVASCLVLATLLSPIALAAQMQPQQISLAAGIQRGYDAIKRNMTEAAQKMPEANYSFQPTPEIRSFGQLFGHVANAQFNNCAVAKGEANPNQGIDNEEKTTMAEFVKALNDSFAYCDPVYAALTDQSAMEYVRQGQNQVMRGWVLANNVTHSNEMYGTTAVYMRLKGLVPPSTERQQQRRPGR